MDCSGDWQLRRWISCRLPSNQGANSHCPAEVLSMQSPGGAFAFRLGQNHAASFPECSAASLRRGKWEH